MEISGKAFSGYFREDLERIFLGLFRKHSRKERKRKWRKGRRGKSMGEASRGNFPDKIKIFFPLAAGKFPGRDEKFSAKEIEWLFYFAQGFLGEEEKLFFLIQKRPGRTLC